MTLTLESLTTTDTPIYVLQQQVADVDKATHSHNEVNDLY